MIKIQEIKNNLFSTTLKIFSEQREKKNKILISFYKKHKSAFETYEIPPGIYKVSFTNKTQDILIKTIVSYDTITKKSRLKTDKNLRFCMQNHFFTVLGLRPNWNYKAIIGRTCRNKKTKITINKKK